MSKLHTPFRYDYVGSFLRPERLKKARADYESGKINKAELTAVEDDCIRELVAKVKELGYHVITDGEFRRSTWHLDFTWGFNGVEHRKTVDGNTAFDAEAAMIDDTYMVGKISVKNHPFVEHFKFVKALEDENTVAKQAIPLIVDALKEKNVEVCGDEYAMQSDSRIVLASDDDWGMEYLDYIISVKTVDSVDEAIEHINTYNTGHSESIITKDYNNANRFLDEIDAACVYVNASTRFSDGFEFGFGAEIGISTQKLHARGPMGLKALTTTKYVIYGEGQIRQ